MKLTITSKEKQVVRALASILVLFGGICLLRQEKQTNKKTSGTTSKLKALHTKDTINKTNRPLTKREDIWKWYIWQGVNM